MRIYSNIKIKKYNSLTFKYFNRRIKYVKNGIKNSIRIKNRKYLK